MDPTPQLLQHFTEADTRWITSDFQYYENRYERWDDTLAKLSVEEKRYLARELAGQRVIDLGCGRYHRENAKIFESLGCMRYVGVDPCPRLDLPAMSHTDALSYLMQQPANSSIVVSFGFFCIGVLYLRFIGGEQWGDEGRTRFDRYASILAREVYRVALNNAITFHIGTTLDDLITAGFRIDTTAPEGLRGKILRK